MKIFDETGTGALPQIMMRGLYESRSGRVQVLEDGIPLALAPYGQTSLSLFPMTMDMVDHIDVVRGGAAVQYGPNNMGGVINIVSRPIPKKWTTSIGERLQIAGNNGHTLFNEDFSTGGYITDRFAAQLDTNFQNEHQFRDSNSHTDVHNVRLRTRYDITDHDRILTDYANYAINTGLPGALTPHQYRVDRYQATRPLDQVTGSTNRGSLVAQHDFHHWAFLTGEQATVTFFADEAKRNYTSGMGRTSATTWDSGMLPQMMQTAPRDFTVYGIQPQLALRTKQWGISHEVSVGARGTFETINYKVNRRNPLTAPLKIFRNWKFNNKAWSTFISDKMGFFHDRLTITPGFRFEHIDEAYNDHLTHTHGLEMETGIFYRG